MVQRVRVGDTVQVVSESADIERQMPKTVTRIDETRERIRVEFEGPEQGEYAVWVEPDGSNQAVYVHPDSGDQPQGEVEVLRLVWPGDRQLEI